MQCATILFFFQLNKLSGEGFSQGYRANQEEKALELKNKEAKETCKRCLGLLNTDGLYMVGIQADADFPLKSLWNEC